MKRTAELQLITEARAELASQGFAWDRPPPIPWTAGLSRRKSQAGKHNDPAYGARKKAAQRAKWKAMGIVK